MGAVKTAQINADAIGIRAGGIKSFDATVLAKSMLSHAGIKLIGSNIIFTRQQAKLSGGHNHLVTTTDIADRTVTGMGVEV